MQQPPIADFHEDRETPIVRGRTTRRPYLKAAPIVALLVAVAAMGASGNLPQLGPEPSTAPSGPTPIPSVAGLSNALVDPNQIIDVDLGLDATPLWESGGAVVVRRGARDVSVLPMTGTYGFPDCVHVAAAAATANQLIVVEVSPGGTAAAEGSCPSFSPTSNWDVYVFDSLSEPNMRVAASGMISAEDEPQALARAPRVAIGGNVYAFSRPDESGDRSTVEVRGLQDDALLYRADPLPKVAQLRVGDGRLAIAAEWSETTDDSQAPRMSVYETRSWADPIGLMGVSTGALAMSGDGSRVAFAACTTSNICHTISILGDEEVGGVPLPVGADQVSVDTGTLRTVAWIAPRSSGDRAPYLGISNSRLPFPTALIGIDPPLWVAVDDDILMWTSLAADRHLHLYSLDLVEAHLGE